MRRSRQLKSAVCLVFTVTIRLASSYGALEGPQASSQPRPTRLHCTVSVGRPQEQRVGMVLELTGVEPGRERLRWTMPEGFAFVGLPEPLIEQLTVTTGERRPLACRHPAPYEWEVTLDGAGTVRMEYAVPLRHRELEAVKRRDAYEYPYLAEDHGLLVSSTLFMFPEDLRVDELRVEFNLPEGWALHTPWRPLGPRAFDPGSQPALLHDLIAIGAWKVHELRVGGFQGTVAFAPGQDALENLAVEPIRRIVQYELELFGRPPEGRYLFLFGRPETPGMSGSPKTSSMTLSVEPRLVAMAGSYLPHLIAHEFFHTWSAGLELPDELRWVGEGFTDYYGYLIPARLGLNTWEGFAATLGEKMQAAASNPRRGKLSLVQAGGPIFFQDRDAYQLVYDGGLLLAAWLDRTLQSAGGRHSLDDLMRAFFNNPGWRSNGTQPTLSDFLHQVQMLAGETAAESLRQFVSQPYDFDPVAALARLGVEVRRETGPPNLDLRANLEGTRLLDLDPQSLGYRIGLRAGDELVEVNGRPVSDPAGVRNAWRNPVGERIRVTLLREGQSMQLDAPLEPSTRFIVPVEPWRASAPASQPGSGS